MRAFQDGCLGILVFLIEQTRTHLTLVLSFPHYWHKGNLLEHHTLGRKCGWYGCFGIGMTSGQALVSYLFLRSTLSLGFYNQLLKSLDNRKFIHLELSIKADFTGCSFDLSNMFLPNKQP